LNTWICYGFLGGGMFTNAYIFFGFGSFPFLETIKSKIIFKNTINAHLSEFKLMSFFLHFWKHNLSFCRWLSMSLYAIKLFRNIFIILSKYFLNALVTALWYVEGPFLTPNKITFHIKAPQSVTNVVLYLSFGVIEFWWHHEYPLKKEYVSHPTILLNISSMKGNGYGSFFVAAFSFLKSI